MEISLSDFKRIITTAAELGVENYMKAREPESDMMKQADAKRYLSKLGIQPVMLRKWADQKLITPVKTGDAQNAPVMYSLVEIKQLIFSLQTYQMIR
jgi:hypothetical protein